MISTAISTNLQFYTACAMSGLESNSASPPDWKIFENSVAAFLSALAPAARITRNAYLPDVDTGEHRQRDVWIETSLGGHIPITILVSCKHKRKKLSQQDLDAFAGELRSSAANKGIIYSFSGFSRPALLKAEKLGISCCNLYVDRSPDIPEVLQFKAYCFREMFRIKASGGIIRSEDQIGELLSSEIEIDGKKETIVAAISASYEEARPKPLKVEAMRTPPIWCGELFLEYGPFRNHAALRLESGWRVYEAKLDAWLLNGSYSFGNSHFHGSITTPWIDGAAAHPGPGWKEIDFSSERAEQNVISVFLTHGNPETDLRQQYRI